MNNNTLLYNYLQSLNIVASSQLDKLYQESESKNLDLTNLILEHDLLSDDNIGRIQADIYQVPFVKLNEIEIDKNLALKLPISFAQKYECLLFKETEKEVTIASTNPLNPNLISRLKVRFNDHFVLVYATKKDLLIAQKIYDLDPQVVFTELLKSSINDASSLKSDPPIIKIVDTILGFAHDNSASDIHIEPSVDSSVIRFRQDGMMQPIFSFPLSIHERIATRIKVMSSLRTDDNQSPQDGKFEHVVDDDRLDIRVSLVPTVHGENIVLRLLSASSRQFSLLDLGLSKESSSLIDSARKKPHGMILVTGPTGSGKTTTLYAILKLLNTSGVNIMTIEDPVEYQIEGISQIQVNKATNLTFADGLKSIVRQDPDIILVGEIRDQETAGIAINSAMTGHLVLSTLHTNNAATTLPRLTDMNIEPFLISSTINIIIAQRLVRKICTHCRVSYETSTTDISPLLSQEQLTKYFPDPKIRLYKGTGCAVCHQHGYKGRVGIFEIMIISDKLKEAILAKKDASIIESIAKQEGMITMLEDGLNKVKTGLTTLEEVLRVTKE